MQGCFLTHERRLNDVIPPARRHFRLELECDGSPFRYHTAAATSTEASTRARAAFAAQPGVSLDRVRVVSCCEVGPA